MALKLFSRNKTERKAKRSESEKRTSVDISGSLMGEFSPAACQTLDEDPLRGLFQQGRHSAILRESAKWAGHPGGETVIQESKLELENRMALVPAGTVSISQTLAAEPGGAEQDSEVQPFLLDVHTVTNARFQPFVDAGGYDQLEFWPEEIWPHLIELKDMTGEAGPRFWRNCRHDNRTTDHPVVGVSWYEAQAFALWIGQRLPTEAEWQMAASWHINSSADLMRRFPWGDAVDNTRCNIWSSRRGGLVPVAEYPKGAAPNQVLQLVGNVWEWTDTEYAVTDSSNQPVVGEMPMHVIRGGACDTYFETQATSHFRTGQIALARTHNTGFRCAMDLEAASWMNEA